MNRPLSLLLIVLKLKFKNLWDKSNACDSNVVNNSNSEVFDVRIGCTKSEREGAEHYELLAVPMS